MDRVLPSRGPASTAIRKIISMSEVGPRKRKRAKEKEKEIRELVKDKTRNGTKNGAKRGAKHAARRYVAGPTTPQAPVPLGAKAVGPQLRMPPQLGAGPHASPIGMQYGTMRLERFAQSSELNYFEPILSHWSSF